MKVAVLGVDTGGREVARRCVHGGTDVSIHAEEPSDAMDAIDAIERHLGSARGARAPDVSLDATTGLSAAVSDADVVVETNGTDAERLQRRFADIEALVDRETLVATNQPTVSVTAAAAGLRHPDRAVGLRFHPGDAALVEVVATDETDPDALDRASSLVETLDATPLAVQDSPGLASARLAVALEVEAMRLLERGVAGVETIDEMLATGYDHPVGPLEQADRAGLDDRLDLLEFLAAEVGERYDPPDVLAERVAVGKTGATAGEGFYTWENGEPTGPAVDGPAFESSPDS